MNTNAKVKESKGYEYWATKHNLNTMAESVIFIREPRVFFLKIHNGQLYKIRKNYDIYMGKEMDRPPTILLSSYLP